MRAGMNRGRPSGWPCASGALPVCSGISGLRCICGLFPVERLRQIRRNTKETRNDRPKRLPSGYWAGWILGCRSPQQAKRSRCEIAYSKPISPLLSARCRGKLKAANLTAFSLTRCFPLFQGSRFGLILVKSSLISSSSYGPTLRVGVDCS